MATLPEEMKADALEAMKLARKYFVIELDYSDGSVDELDSLLEQVEYAMPGGVSEENVATLSRVCGAYLGELLRRRRRGQWIQTDDGKISLHSETATLHPHDQVRKRLLDQSKESLRQYYESALQKL